MDDLKALEQAVDTGKALNKEKQLEKLLHSFETATVAFSGGVDSSYLLGKAFRVLGSKNVQAVTLKSVLNPNKEVEEAALFALKLGVRHHVINIDIIADLDFTANTSERCYYCKRNCFKKIVSVSAAGGFKVVLDGSNADDLRDHRPGMRAAKELNIQSPLLEVRLGKQEIRYLSGKEGFSTWNKPAAACLATRIPYGEEITLAKLKKAADAEKYLRKLGLKDNLRVRCHGNIARIEVNESDLDFIITHRQEINTALQKIGFTYVAVDLHGFESGSMNRSKNPQIF